MKAQSSAERAQVALANFKPLLKQRDQRRLYHGVAEYEGELTTEQLFNRAPDALAAQQPSWKSFNWSLLSAGDCACSEGRLVLNSWGSMGWSCSLTSSDLGDDAWGIRHFDFYQGNGAHLWSSGDFWSPTIVSVGQFWSFQSTFPVVWYPYVATISITYHC
jgi:hypothetical protein